ncbi:IPT/TIG domain-containing protein [Nocardia lijiangensis]|uniref:IPT/TIG domain-containing protein n=1 Tax=Nocardia lijiangensis TaxID=299618 RepID=UPI0008372447|nr:IPT/TIG domain-containing protein [Nocardia lijiangensis]
MAQITSVSPRTAKLSGGDQLVVKGSGFTGVSRVFVENVNFKQWDAQFTVDSPSQITLTMPATTGGRMHVFVVANGRESTVPQVPVLESDGDRLTSAGTGGANWTTEAGPAAQIDVTDFGPAEAAEALNQAWLSNMPTRLPPDLFDQ